MNRIATIFFIAIHLLLVKYLIFKLVWVWLIILLVNVNLYDKITDVICGWSSKWYAKYNPYPYNCEKYENKRANKCSDQELLEYRQYRYDTLLVQPTYYFTIRDHLHTICIYLFLHYPAYLALWVLDSRYTRLPPVIFLVYFFY